MCHDERIIEGWLHCCHHNSNWRNFAGSSWIGNWFVTFIDYVFFVDVLNIYSKITSLMSKNIKYGADVGWNSSDSKISGCKLNDWCLIPSKDNDFILHHHMHCEAY